ncbi:hypothetical protein [Pseudomonas syringae]|uniref:hypothetical protein n=1 Tax=Pseudomonas syringae TaxID=317 RepID=UPI0018E5CA80|nr:hypothetical protein [Pseudomonas syringae]MBI6794656.1 hypothetical protein [Pseudomonas syringae]
MGLPDLSAWQVEMLRVTVFFSTPVSAVGMNWWQRVTGMEPESTTNRPQAGEYSEVGQYQNGQLELKVAFNRLDFIFSYPFSGMPGAPDPGKMEELSSHLVSSVNKVFPGMELPIVRLAFGVVAHCPIPTIDDGNSILEMMVPFIKFDSSVKTSDVLIQVNNPVGSKVAKEITVNRVSKVGVMTRQTVTVGPGGIPDLQVDRVVRAESDMSTDAENVSQIPSAALEDLVLEMKGLSDAFFSVGVKA